MRIFHYILTHFRMMLFHFNHHLSKHSKIHILRNAKKYFINDFSFDVGMCGYIYHALKEYGMNDLKVEKYIPEFTFENIEKLSKIYGFNPPTKGYNWWNVKDKQTRIDVFDALVHSIKHSDKNL